LISCNFFRNSLNTIQLKFDSSELLTKFRSTYWSWAIIRIFSYNWIEFPYIESVTTKRLKTMTLHNHNITFIRVLHCQCQRGNPKW